jgi:peptidyl-prolyl cis-trans isomerase C
MRQYVRSGLIASIFAGLAAVAGAQTPGASKAGTPPAGPATKAATPSRPAILDQVLATVNGKPITREELIRFFNATGLPPGADEQESYKFGIENLINHELVKQFLLRQKSLEVSDKELDAEFSEFEKKFKEDGQDINVALASHGVTSAQVKDDMKSRLRWTKYLDAVSTDVNLKKFVAENKDVFNQTQVQASHIVLIVPEAAAAAEKEKIKQKLVAIKKEIDSGKISFADAANKYSEDDGNKASPRGGDIGFFPRRAYNEQFTAAAFALKKGVVSDVVESPFGYHLILVTDRKEGPPIDFEAKKLLIRNDYASDLNERIVASERKTAKIDIKPMPADIFPKAPPQQPAGTPEPGKAATKPAGTPTPK